MPSNNTGKTVRELFKKYPDKLALLLNVRSFRPHQFEFRYAIDNDCFNQFNENQYFGFLDKSKKFNPPMFVVCPDVVGCHDRTIALWHYYYSKIKSYNYPIAFVAQNGCEPELVPKKSDWIFIGGLDPWKQENIHNFVGLGKPVHVGRVNGIGRLRYCESLGVTSVDGTGWLKFNNYQTRDLKEYLSGEGKQRALFTK